MADHPAAANEPVLSLRGISKNFGAVWALIDIELDVHAGEVVGLVGDSATYPAGALPKAKPPGGRDRSGEFTAQFPARTGDGLMFGLFPI